MKRLGFFSFNLPVSKLAWTLLSNNTRIHALKPVGPHASSQMGQGLFDSYWWARVMAETSATPDRIQEPFSRPHFLEMAILIVEDDFNSREGLKLTLAAEGYRVEAVRDGLHAIKRILERRFAAAIIDINLPPIMDVTITGWDLVHLFRSLDPAMSIIVVSAEDGVESRAKQSQVSGFLRKPIKPSQLKVMLKTVARYQGNLFQPPDLPVS